MANGMVEGRERERIENDGVRGCGNAKMERMEHGGSREGERKLSRRGERRGGSVEREGE